jgi:hypothetical protein
MVRATRIPVCVIWVRLTFPAYNTFVSMQTGMTSTPEGIPSKSDSPQETQSSLGWEPQTRIHVRMVGHARLLRSDALSSGASSSRACTVLWVLDGVDV